MFYRSGVSDRSFLTKSANSDSRIEIKLNFERKLLSDDLKMLYLISERCGDQLYLNLKAKELTQEQFDEELENASSKGCIAKLKAKRSEICSYKFYDNIEERVNFYLLTKFAYLSFILNICFCIMIPVFFKARDCGKGSKWWGHIIFSLYIVGSMIIEAIITLCAFNKETRKSFFKSGNCCLTYLVFFLYALIGAIAKGDIYTDVAFLVEMEKCNAKNEEIAGVIIWLISIVVFSMTLLYQFICLASLIFTQPGSTPCPLTSHMTRVLMCSDYRLLAMLVDKFSVSYYQKILCFETSTNKILAMSKLVFEDICQCALQIVYLMIAIGLNKNKTVIIVSLCFAVPSILSSIHAILYNSTSGLTRKDYQTIINKIGRLKEDASYHDTENLASIEEAPANKENDVSAARFAKRINFGDDSPESQNSEESKTPNDERQRKDHFVYNNHLAASIRRPNSRFSSSRGSFSTLERAGSTVKLFDGSKVDSESNPDASYLDVNQIDCNVDKLTCSSPSPLIKRRSENPDARPPIIGDISKPPLYSHRSKRSQEIESKLPQIFVGELCKSDSS